MSFVGALRDRKPTEGGFSVAALANSRGVPCRSGWWSVWSIGIVLKLFCRLCLVNDTVWMALRTKVISVPLLTPKGRHASNLQRPRDGMERNFRGQLRPFLNFSEFLDADHSSILLLILEGSITLTMQYKKLGEFRGGYRGSFPQATKIPPLVHLFWLIFKSERRDQRAGAQVYHYSKLRISFLGRIQRYLHNFYANSKDIV